MKRENYQRVQEIIKEIEEDESTLDILNFNSTHVRICYGNSSSNVILTIRQNENTVLSAITKNYIEAVKIHYETEIEKLNKELETL